MLGPELQSFSVPRLQYSLQVVHFEVRIELNPKKALLSNVLMENFQ